MTVKESLGSKAMLAGYGLVCLGGYMMFALNMNEFGLGVIMNGLGYIGVRDAK